MLLKKTVTVELFNDSINDKRIVELPIEDVINHMSYAKAKDTYRYLGLSGYCNEVKDGIEIVIASDPEYLIPYYYFFTTLYDYELCPSYRSKKEIFPVELVEAAFKVQKQFPSGNVWTIIENPTNRTLEIKVDDHFCSLIFYPSIISPLIEELKEIIKEVPKNCFPYSMFTRVYGCNNTKNFLTIDLTDYSYRIVDD